MKQECPTYLKLIGKSKALAATLSDTEPEIEPKIEFYLTRVIFRKEINQRFKNNSVNRAIHHPPSLTNPTGPTISDLITTRSERWFDRLRVASVKTRHNQFESRFDYLRNRRTRPARCELHRQI